MTSYTNATPAGTSDSTARVIPNDEVVDVLDDLLENTRDGEYGFRACAEEVNSEQLKRVFQERASQCATAASELGGLIRQLGGEVDDGGSVSGAMHRGWVHVKGKIGADSPFSMLEECERGEDAAVARYRKALKAELPAEVRAVVQRQAEGAQRNHDQIKSLRDQMRAAKA
ncbi:ferritin-like domain-containing protein [Variovorax sp. Root411]|uniref:ferritin-like domain-containing protein n=1 Tax=Variovorax sp. Root411 TaxID=1736530 RepID=UPI0007003244|nr:PA2169 family four-helix-bundle protein [Variovorax sp. Root411]KQW54343.1 aldehyde dehydrogenase [Variovorax sp. Root411]